MTRKNGDAYIYFDKDTDFTGEIESKRIVLEGRINGVVHAEKQIHLKRGACIKGEIYTGHFKADEGSSCSGELKVGYFEERENGEKAGNGEKKENIFMKAASMMTTL